MLAVTSPLDSKCYVKKKCILNKKIITCVFLQSGTKFNQPLGVLNVDWDLYTLQILQNVTVTDSL